MAGIVGGSSVGVLVIHSAARLRRSAIEYALQASGGTAGNYEDILEWARFAEQADLAAFALPDHYVRGGGNSGVALDALAVMAGLARDTDSIDLVLLVSPVTWRHPGVLAKTAATLQQMSGGRLTLGVGTGWLEREHQLFGFSFPDTATRFEMLEEALAYLRASHAEPPQDFVGKHYNFEAFDMLPRPELKIVVGGTGTHKTPRLAGKYADELNTYPAPPEVFAQKIARARQAATDAGRDPNELRISSSGILVAGDDEKEYQQRLAELAEMLDTEIETLIEDMEKRNSPRGTWEQVRSTIDAMAAEGMTRFYIQAFGNEMSDISHAIDRLTV